jgi:lysophospholipase L1-like esterase
VSPVRARWTVLALVVLALAGTGGTAWAQGGTRYVALGDSYAAGPLVPPPGGGPVGCLRSGANYPSLVAEGLAITDFTDVSCSGATTDDLSAPQSAGLGTNPAQLSALTGDESLVSMTMGGNDIGFANIITTCAAKSPLKPLGAACKDFYGTQLDDRVAATAPKIAASLAAIHERAPQARIALVGYPALLPDTGPGCFPVVPFSPGDVAWLRDLEKQLNGVLAEEAVAAGATYVDTYTPSIGHDMCQLPGTKWIEGLIPTSPAAPVHPNALGTAGMADAVLTTLTATPAA